MVDLHAHVLPGLDDGAKDLADALALLAAYRSQGVTDVVCTPHLPPPGAPELDPDGLAALLSARDRALDGLRAVAAEPFPGLRLHPGAELLLSAGLEDVLGGPLHACGLAGSTHLLVETPVNLTGSLRAIDRMLFRIQLAGAMPVLAHPDRMSLSDAELDELAGWAALDRVRLLLNAVSLLSPDAVPPERREHHRRRHAAALRLLESGAVFAVASDTHGAAARPPLLGPAYRAVAGRFGMAAAESLFVGNPRTVLQEGGAA